MGRRKAHVPLNVLINNRHVGRMSRETSGRTVFQYDRAWLEWEHTFGISLSLPLREEAYAGAAVLAVFDNLLPDSDAVRHLVAERTGAEGTDAYSLLARIGRDCVGAMQFLPDDAPLETDPSRPSEHGCGHSSSRRTDGRRESTLGSPSDPR